jgi:hypothetical protein
LARVLRSRKTVVKNFNIKQDPTENQYFEFDVNGEYFKVNERTYGRLIISHVKLFEFIDLLLHFDLNHKTPGNMVFLKNIDTAGYMSRPINTYNPEPMDFQEIFGKDAYDYVVAVSGE